MRILYCLLLGVCFLACDRSVDSTNFYVSYRVYAEKASVGEIRIFYTNENGVLLSKGDIASTPYYTKKYGPLKEGQVVRLRFEREQSIAQFRLQIVINNSVHEETVILPNENKAELSVEI